MAEEFRVSICAIIVSDIILGLEGDLCDAMGAKEVQKGRMNLNWIASRAYLASLPLTFVVQARSFFFLVLVSFAVCPLLSKRNDSVLRPWP